MKTLTVPNLPGEEGFVPAAARTARRLSLAELEDPHTLERFYGIRRNLTQKLRQVLPIESQLQKSVRHHLDTVDHAIARYEYGAQLDLPMIDPSFLSWKTMDGFPAFSIFSLESDVMSITFNQNNFARFEALVRAMERRGELPPDLLSRQYGENPIFSIMPPIPEIMAKHYLDANLRCILRDRCGRRNLEQITLRARYGGIMPDEVREKIRYWRDPVIGRPRFDRILIVAEAPASSWEIEEIPKKDPLVIGVAGGFLWLIAAYDLTPVESFAREMSLQLGLDETRN